MAMARAVSAQPSTQGLKSVKLLEGLPVLVLETLARQCRWRRVAAGQMVISRDAPDTDLYIIVSGHVRAAAYSANGRQVTYRDISGGEWFGELAALDGLARSADVVAMADSLVASMSPAVFRALLRENAVVSERILLRLAGSVRELTERIFELSTLGVQNRLHGELLRLAREAGVRDNSARLEPPPRHIEIASNIGTYREQVTRELSAMAKQGLVRRSRSALVIPDVVRLQQLVSEVRRSR